MDVRTPVDVLSFGSFRLAHGGSSLFRYESDTLSPIRLSSRALAVLKVLIERRGELVLKDEIMAAVWPDTVVEDANLTVQISALRRVLDAGRADGSWIQTISGRGYRFLGEVTQVAAQRAEPERSLTHQAAGHRAAPAHRQEPTSAMQAAGDPPQRRVRVGRTGPLEAFDDLVQRMLTGNRQVVFVTGEAGIGKTTFVEMVTERISRRGIGILAGHCTELFGTNEAFLPLIDALTERCREPDGDFVVQILRDHSPTWLAQMPKFLSAGDRASFHSETFGATRERMLREFCDFLEILSADRPWVVVLEDLHWSDFATLDAIARFARGERKAPVLIVATYRPADVLIKGHPVRALHQDLRLRGHACSELALERLSAGDVTEYLERRFGGAQIAQVLADRIFARTQGQPLFFASLVEDLIAQKIILQTEGQWQIASDAAFPPGLPDDLRDMLIRQIEHLTVDEQHMLEVASVGGGDFSAATVAHAMNKDSLEVEQALESLAQKGIVLDALGATEWPDGTYSGSYSFHHALYQETLYQRLAPGRRAQLHRRFGEHLEAGCLAQATDIAPLLAQHFEKGRDFPKAMRYLGEAAASAARRFGNLEAVSYLSRALDLAPRLPAGFQSQTRIALLRHRSWARRSLGDLDGSLDDLNDMIALAADAGQLLVEINGLMAVSRFCLHADRRKCLAANALALEKSAALDDDVFRALVQGTSASLNLYLKGWREEDAQLCRRSLELTAKSTDHGTLLRRYGIEGILTCSISEYRACRVAAQHGKDTTRRMGDVFMFVLFNVLEATALLHLGEWRDLRRETTLALAMAERNANRPAVVLCELTLAWLEVEALDHAGAKRRCDDIDEAVFEGNLFAYYFHRAVLAKACLGLGDHAGALRRIHEVLEKLELEDGDLDFTIYTQFYHCYCEYSLATGALDHARQQAEKLYKYSVSAPDRNHLALAYSLMARIAQAEGDVVVAGTCIDRAIATLGHDDLPLAARRVYQAATEYYAFAGDESRAAECRSRHQKVIQTLAANFGDDDPLRQSLLGCIS
jgi:DNA-binding winged helix-turn-helix (wHTH) protein